MEGLQSGLGWDFAGAGSRGSSSDEHLASGTITPVDLIFVFSLGDSSERREEETDGETTEKKSRFSIERR